MSTMRIFPSPKPFTTNGSTRFPAFGSNTILTYSRFMILWLLVSVFGSCSKDPSARQQSQRGDSATIRVLTIGSQYLLVIPTPSEVSSVQTIYVVDWGSQARPMNFRLPELVYSAHFEEGDRDLVLAAQSPSANWRFSVRNDIEATTEETTILVAGLSKLNDPIGFDEQVLVAKGDELDAFELARSARLSLRSEGGSGRPDLCACASGGPGATACSISNGGKSCSVSCGNGYYACCDAFAQECRCCRE